MRTTIDAAGRVVIPKPLREMAGFVEGAEIDIEFRDGKIEIESRAAPMSVKKVGCRVVIVAPTGTPRMPASLVDTARRSTRAEREGKHLARLKRS